jgi:AcrR family transcriptional regulator
MTKDTREHILDAAERLFAESGIDAVSMRTITAEAGVNLAAIHYHFGSKEELVKAVFSRPIEHLNRQRLALLNACEARSGEEAPPVEDVLRCLIAPSIRLSQAGERGEMFMRLCGRIHTETAEYLQVAFDELFQEIKERFGAALRRALPQLPMGEIFWRSYFTIGAMVHTMRDLAKLQRFSEGLCDTTDIEGMIERLVQFGAAGMRAPVPTPGAPDGTGAAQSTVVTTAEAKA